MRILIVEDEADLAQSLRKGLSEEGFAVDIAGNGEEGRFLAGTEPYDVIVLDIMLPKLDGISLCKAIRKEGINTPILMLTAKATVDEKVAGLECGADDYLTKPFDFAELTARLHALLRRGGGIQSPVLTADDLTVDPQKHEVYRAGEKVELTPKEFSILEYLLRNKNKVVTRTMITEHVWDYNFESMSNLVDVLVGTLRKKVEKKDLKKLIYTVYGVGFKISDDKKS